MADQVDKSRQKVVGTKQTIKALEQKRALEVFVAGDADEKVVRPVVFLCEKNDIEPQHIDTMIQLGKMFGIKVKAATAATLKD